MRELMALAALGAANLAASDAFGPGPFRRVRERVDHTVTEKPISKRKARRMRRKKA